MTDDVIAVLVVEDEPTAAAAHAAAVRRIAGFDVVGVVGSAREAMLFLRAHPVDVVLLDFNLPDGHGLEICRALRMARADVDVIAVTANRDLPSVRSAVSLGVVQYVLKPFTFRSLADKLAQYRDFRQALRDGSAVAGQTEIDRAFAVLRQPGGQTLPSGLVDATLDAVAAQLQNTTGRSAMEVAADSGVSRVTARRYLEHLVSVGTAARHQRHGQHGRPEVEYRWVGR